MAIDVADSLSPKINQARYSKASSFLCQSGHSFTTVATNCGGSTVIII
jgi:hypothetical protein